MASKSPMTTAGVMRLIAREMGRAATACPVGAHGMTGPDNQEKWLAANREVEAMLLHRFQRSNVSAGELAMELVRSEEFRTRFLVMVAAEAAIVAAQFHYGLGEDCFPSELRRQAEQAAANEVSAVVDPEHPGYEEYQAHLEHLATPIGDEY